MYRQTTGRTCVLGNAGLNNTPNRSGKETLRRTNAVLGIYICTGLSQICRKSAGTPSVRSRRLYANPRLCGNGALFHWQSITKGPPKLPSPPSLLFPFIISSYSRFFSPIVSTQSVNKPAPSPGFDLLVYRQVTTKFRYYFPLISDFLVQNFNKKRHQPLPSA